MINYNQVYIYIANCAYGSISALTPHFNSDFSPEGGFKVSSVLGTHNTPFR
jgi:hypothetical protein